MLIGIAAAAAISVLTIHANPNHAPASDARGPAILPTTLAFGAIDPNGVIPTVDGVSGAGTDNWDIAWPLGVLATDNNYAETFSFQDAHYSGSCNFEVTITSKKTGGRIARPRNKTITCSPGDVFLVSTQTGTLQGLTGPAEAKLTIFFGAKKASIKVPLLIK